MTINPTVVNAMLAELEAQRGIAHTRAANLAGENAALKERIQALEAEAERRALADAVEAEGDGA